MILISAYQIGKSFGAQRLFRDLTFSISSGQKIGLIGPNGAGKSTLLKILAKLETADSGQLSFANSLRLGVLEQEPQMNATETVAESILNATDDPYDADNIGWAYELMSRLQLDSAECGFDRPLNELSGGWLKRVALAWTLAKKPDLILLDEPTNHLDVVSIQWLEEFLASRPEMAVLTVTHDRLFLQNTCDWIFDLDPRNPDGLLQIKGTYADFLDLKNATMSAQKTLEEVRSNQLRRETAWLRRGAKARQTKQKARIDRAHELADDVSDLKEQNRDRKVKFDLGDVLRNPKKIIDAQKIGKKAGDRWLFRNFSFQLGARSRVGILGPNGCGKTTLIQTLIGNLQPDEGTVKVSDGIKFAYFEQRKKTLIETQSVLKTICPEGDYVQVQGKPVFAKSYLARFQFRPDQMDLPVAKLSGGEKSRLLLSSLMLQSEPVFIMDEPTNDLDIATLDTLEQALQEFQGAVILITHDRYFMSQVCDVILAFTPDGDIMPFADLFQWERWFEEDKKNRAKKLKAPASVVKEQNSSPAKILKKLGFKEQQELEQMESVIQAEEALLAKMVQNMASNGIQSDFAQLARLTKEMEAQQAKVDGLYARWEELNQKAGLV